VRISKRRNRSLRGKGKTGSAPNLSTERHTTSKRKIRRILGCQKGEALFGRANVRHTRWLWSLPGLLANLIGDASERHRFLFRAHIVDGRTPAQMTDAGDDFVVLRWLRAKAAGS
jgi:hypothetical protein